MDGNRVAMAPCDHKQTYQYWTHNYYQELNSRKHCLDYTGKTLGVYGCHRSRQNQAWEYAIESGQLKSVKHGGCLGVNTKDNQSLLIEPCDEKRDSQKWLVTLVELDVSFFGQTPK